MLADWAKVRVCQTSSNSNEEELIWGIWNPWNCIVKADIKNTQKIAIHRQRWKSYNKLVRNSCEDIHPINERLLNTGYERQNTAQNWELNSDEWRHLMKFCIRLAWMMDGCLCFDDDNAIKTAPFKGRFIVIALQEGNLLKNYLKIVASHSWTDLKFLHHSFRGRSGLERIFGF